MFKMILSVILILLIISALLILLRKKRNQATQIFTIPTFLGSSSYNDFENETLEQKKSIIDTINDFFKDSNDANDDGDSDGDDAGE